MVVARSQERTVVPGKSKQLLVTPSLVHNQRLAPVAHPIRHHHQWSVHGVVGRHVRPVRVGQQVLKHDKTPVGT